MLNHIIVLGAEAIGKTALIDKLINKTPFLEKYDPTIAVSMIPMTTENLKMIFWDCSGQKRFKPYISAYCKGKKLHILCFDLSDKKAFDSLDSQLNEIKNCVEEKTPILLVGTKADIQQINDSEISHYVQNKKDSGFPIKGEAVLTSAKDNKNMDTLLDRIKACIHDKQNEAENNSAPAAHCDFEQKASIFSGQLIFGIVAAAGVGILLLGVYLSFVIPSILPFVLIAGGALITGSSIAAKRFFTPSTVDKDELSTATQGRPCL